MGLIKKSVDRGKIVSGIDLLDGEPTRGGTVRTLHIKVNNYDDTNTCGPVEINLGPVRWTYTDPDAT